MFTTFAAVALSAALNASELSPAGMQSDYGRAMAVAAEQGKPVAVFIGRGEAGLGKVVDGAIPAAAEQLLAKNYVSVYVDTDTAAGKSLAGQFGLSNGLVISSKSGKLQALRHAGAVDPVDLSAYLTKYSDPARVVSTTEKVGEVSAVVPAGAVVGGCANGRCGVVSPAYYSAPAYYPGFSSCPNGRCPNAR